MKKLSVKMKITLWYTGLIVIILSAIFTAVLLATDKVLLLGVQNKLEEEVYDFAEELKVESNGRLRLEKLDFLKDGVRLAVYHENGQMITGLVASGLPETPFADELLQKAGSDQQNWFVYDFYFKPRHADNFYWYVERYRSVLHMRNGIRFCGSAHCFFRCWSYWLPWAATGSLKRLFVR